MHVSYLCFNGLIAHFCAALYNIQLFGCTTLYLSIHLTEGHLGYFQDLEIMNKAAINICVQIFV